jgi:hypothetical protein
VCFQKKERKEGQMRQVTGQPGQQFVIPKK